MDMNAGQDPIVLHGLGAVADIRAVREQEETLQRMIMADKMKQAAAAAAQPGQTDEIPLLTEAIKTGAMDSELDDLEEAISIRRAALSNAVTCPKCGEAGYDDPWDCTYCIEEGSRACIYPERPDDATMKKMLKWRWEYEQNETKRQLEALRKEYGM